MSGHKGLAKWFKQDWRDISSKRKDGSFAKCGRTKQKKDAISIVDIAPTYVSTKDVSLALSKRIGEARGVPPKKGPNPQGLKTGGINTGCPHRENGVKSDIKGISSIQIKGKKFIGVR